MRVDLLAGDLVRLRHVRVDLRARALRAGGSDLKHVIKVTIFLTDMSHFEKIVELRGRYFAPPYPADTIVEVRSLYSADAMIEIEAIAVAIDAVSTK